MIGAASAQDSTTTRKDRKKKVVIHHFNRIIKNKWVWGVFAVLISAFFAFDFIFDSRGDTRGPDGAGKLGGETVSRMKFDDARADVFAEIRLQYGREISLKAPQLNKLVWHRLVLLKAAEDMKLVVSDEDVQAAITQGFTDPQTGAYNGALLNAMCQPAFMLHEIADRNIFLFSSRPVVQIRRIARIHGSAVFSELNKVDVL